MDDLKRLTRRRRDHRHALLDNARFVLGDARERAAAAVGVIHGDICNDGQHRLYDICRIEQTAEPRLNDGDLHLLLGKIEERERRQRLELRRVLMSLRGHRVRRRTHAR